MTRVRFVEFTSLSVTVAALGLGLVAAAPATAQGYGGRPQMSPEQACQNDAYRFCERFIPDRRTTGACLRRNKRLLSPDCRAYFTTRKLRRS